MKSVVVDLNAQYIKALFPNARIIIDRFHIVQLVGRTLGMKKMNDCHCKEYEILKAHWRLFHKDSSDLEAARSVSFPGIKTDGRVLVRNRGLALMIEPVLRSTAFDKKSIIGKSPNLKVQV